MGLEMITKEEAEIAFKVLKHLLENEKIDYDLKKDMRSCRENLEVLDKRHELINIMAKIETDYSLVSD